MANVKKIKIQLRHDISANWENKNPVLLPGEFGFDETTRYVKVGDGTTYWKDLSVIKLPKEAIDNIEEVNTDTLFDLSVSNDKLSVILLSANGTLSSNEYMEKNIIELKDWTNEITNAINALSSNLGTNISSDNIQCIGLKTNNLSSETSITIGNTTISEIQLQKLLKLINEISS